MAAGQIDTKEKIKKNKAQVPTSGGKDTKSSRRSGLMFGLLAFLTALLIMLLD